MLLTAVSALGVANTVQWRRNLSLSTEINQVRQAEKDDCATKLLALETRVGKLEASGELWFQRWAREVERNVTLAQSPPRFRPPMPSWEEESSVRNLREEIETKVTRRPPPRGL